MRVCFEHLNAGSENKPPRVTIHFLVLVPIFAESVQLFRKFRTSYS